MAVGAYSSKDITVLRPMEAVRLRPAMYVGDVGRRGMHHLVWEVVDNSVDEAMQGHCDNITVTLKGDGRTVAVEDNGRGIPVDVLAGDKRSTLEVVMTELHAGGKFGGAGYDESGGLHGVGVSCVNALSERLEVTVWRADKSAGQVGQFVQVFERGTPSGPVRRTGDTKRTGTLVVFSPDKEIFKGVPEYDEEMISKRLRETAHLNPGLTVRFLSEISGRDDTYRSDAGVAELLTGLLRGFETVFPSAPVVFEGKHGGVTVRVAMQWVTADGEYSYCYANNINTCDGGTHLVGLKKAVTYCVNAAAKTQSLVKESLSGDDIRDGCAAVVSVRLRQPQFEGQTKGKLQSPEAESAVYQVVSERLSTWLEQNPSFLKQIVERATTAQRIREAQKREADAIKRKTFLGKSNRLPGKLKDCDSDKLDSTELFIVEGDSAGGSAKDGRDPNTQAILPLKGKIINAEKHNLASLLQNDEIKSLVAAIGGGIDIPGKETHSPAGRRYGKYILMTDADVDGSHISTLILTFLFRFMRGLVVDGHVYLANPPLYKVTPPKGAALYCWDDAELRSALAKGGSKCAVTRFKGLGEMNAEELAVTTMDRSTRRLTKVTVPDGAEAEDTIQKFMGKSVGERRAYLLQRSHEALVGIRERGIDAEG